MDAALLGVDNPVVGEALGVTADRSAQSVQMFRNGMNKKKEPKNENYSASTNRCC